jgi:putative PEP-CTERM system histidine kinase
MDVSDTKNTYPMSMIIAGLYLFSIGLATEAVQASLPLPVESLIIFLSLLGIVIAFLSDRLRLWIKQFVSRHLKLSPYDYGDIWATFSNHTSLITDQRSFCATVVKLISKIFDSLSVTIWLLDETHGTIRCAGSTMFTEAEAEKLTINNRATLTIADRINSAQAVVDSKTLLLHPLDKSDSGIESFLTSAHIDYVLPLFSGDDYLGFVSLGDRVQGHRLNDEDCRLLMTIAHQISSTLMNLKLADRLRDAKEMEAFQIVSAFFVHDLKNLAHRLSMMFRNMQIHFDSPEFREDALALMSRSVEKINAICSQLSVLGKKRAVSFEKVDLNELVSQLLESLTPSLNGRLVQRLEPVPDMTADPDQLKTVLTNLILNAQDAIDSNGRITVNTHWDNGWAVVAVSDDGCGISDTFMKGRLFKPFQTTKKHGSGIGLFQSKMIVEDHGGRIEVESEEGKGSTFRLLLPILEEKKVERTDPRSTIKE